MPNYIVVLGSIMSGLGKGILTASIGKILQSRGFKVKPMKFDGYLNVDCGTMNPFRHGEVFVLRDGKEVDMDFGTYERFLNIDLDADASITGGRIFKDIIEREREGKFLGRDVQFVPHVTNWIKDHIVSYANKNNLDFLIIEVGGTVGDIENSYFIEALRQLSMKEKVMFVQLTYLPNLYGELKTKPTQHATQILRGMGIQPSVIVARANKRLDKETREKIKLYCNVDYVMNDHELSTVYELPLLLEQEGMYEAIRTFFKLECRKAELDSWESRVNKLKTSPHKGKIAIVGKYTKQVDSYASLREALINASAELGIKPSIEFVEAEDIKGNVEQLSQYDGIIVPGGFGKRGVEEKIKAIQFARENKKPFLGICFGMQLMAVEFARNVMGLDACSEEIESCKDPAVILQPNQKDVKQIGGTLRLGDYEMDIKEGTILHEIYGKDKAIERHRHRYEINPKYILSFEDNGLIVSATHKDLIEAMEYDRKKFGFGIGLQAHPEFTSRFERPSPVFVRFLKESLASFLGS